MRHITLTVAAIVMTVATGGCVLTEAGDRAMVRNDDVASTMPASQRTGVNRNARISVDDILGKDGAWLQATLGRPGLLRRDGDAEIWQYRNDACALNVFFYASGTAMQASHMDARTSDGAPMDRGDCLAQLRH